MSIHRGTVVSGVDPSGLGRLHVTVPEVEPDRLMWAMPVLPLGSGEAAPPPQPGSAVWVTLERGDPDLPVVLGRLPAAPVITPAQLAAELGHDDGERPGRRVRQYLRERYPDHPRRERWRLTPAQADEVRRHFRP